MPSTARIHRCTRRRDHLAAGGAGAKGVDTGQHNTEAQPATTASFMQGLKEAGFIETRTWPLDEINCLGRTSVPWATNRLRRKPRVQDGFPVPGYRAPRNPYARE